MVTYPGVYVGVEAGGPRTIAGVATSVAAFVDCFERGPLGEPLRCITYAQFEAEFGPSAPVRQFFENGGREAWAVRAASHLTGLHALEKVDLFNILCLPGAADLAPPDMQAAYAAAIACCERRRAFLIIDIPKDVDTPARMQAWLVQNESLRHRNAAVYFPRTLVADPLNHNHQRDIGASGTIAGMYARIDMARGVWKAPAGTDARLYGVQDFPYHLTDAEQGVLNPLGVNCLRTLAAFGYLCWGARTLDAEWKYISVRRLALFVEESMYRGTQWVVSEPNEEPLWAKIRRSVAVCMTTFFRQGAFAGSTPDEAYYVRCGVETMTQNDIDKGIVNIQIGFAPLKPTEFVVINIQQIAAHRN